MASLPNPRDLLTSLLTTLASPPNPPSSPTAPNPLRDAPPEKAALLSTLHVLFPSLLLPALDLLDRGLVTRVLRKPTAEPHATQRGQEEEEGGEAERTEGREGETGEKGLYVVKSLASTMKRKESGYYIVLLAPWTCTCPAFTLDAFPPNPPIPNEDTAGNTRRPSGPDPKWSFGGLAADANPPCCKHLLACVLAERWADVLGRYVPVRRVGRGEMAGLVADV